MTISAFPLQWPIGFQRTKTREKGAFKTSLPVALTNVQRSLRMFAEDSGKQLTTLVMSSNVTLGESRPTDPGVAVWFTWDGMGLCVAVDRYLTVESNLQAIHHIIEARRVELRHGTLAMVRATFIGFLALPAPAPPPWWEVLGVSKTASHADIQEAYRKLRSQHHPDNGGDQTRFEQVIKAHREATA